MPATSGVQTTDPFNSLQAGKTVDISRCASEINRLSSLSALPRSLRSLRLFPPARPAAGRLPAAAGHRAAVVDINVIDGSSDYGSLNQSQYHRMCCLLPIGGIAIYRDLRQVNCVLICGCYTAIGENDTFDYSRLRRNSAFYQCEGQCRASVVHSHYGLDRQCCGRESRKAVRCCLYAGKPAQKHCWGYSAPLCRQSRQRRATGCWRSR